MNSLTRIRSCNVQIGSDYVLPLEDGIKEEETKLEQMVKIAESKRQQIIRDGEKKAQEIISKAQELVEQVQAECSQLIESAKLQAQSESDEIKEKANKEGFDAGYKQGYDDGTKALEEKFETLEIFVNSQYDIKHNIIKSAELDIIDLVIAIARKVCQKTLEEDVDVLKKITVEAIKQLKDKESITITINPELSEKLSAISDKIKEEIPKLESIKIVEDYNVSADGTIVETPLSRVDSRLKTQIDQIAEKMMAKHYSTVEDDKMSRLSGVMKDEVTDNLQIEFEDVEEATLEDINLAFVKEKESLEAEERKNAENGDLNNGGTV